MMNELPLRIILEKPTAGVDFGIQQGGGSAYQTILKQRSKQQDLLFEFTVTLKQSESSAPDFSGKCVHGPRGERFIYIDIGTCAGQADSPWSRRLKIPLKGIDAGMIAALSKEPAMLLETKVPGVGRDGGPNCATVKPFAGWHPAKQ